MFATLDLIPDAWQSGPLNEIIMIGAVVGALGVIIKMVVFPVVGWARALATAIETAVNRISDVPEHEDRLAGIDEQLCAIRDALKPTNGDRRSISDRLDTVKQQTIQNHSDLNDLKLNLERIGVLP
jgi:hypothetical protein